MSSLYTRLKITLGSANADAHALAALESDYKVEVELGRDLIFRPASKQPAIGVILYPGGRCDARAYAPVVRPLAAAGACVVIPNMPLRLAVLDANRVAKIIAAHPDIDRWILGGHSMGGAIAAAYVHKRPESVQGLFFLASYAAKMHAMREATLPVAMIYGTHDFVTRKTEFEASSERLPEHTEYVAIEGGDHYQFGSFANAECTATISRDIQQAQTTSALQRFINRIPY
jgi:pimeloyl-ACP methyl ester carboxylesterase